MNEDEERAERIAETLRERGYRDVTAQMVTEVTDAMKAGVTGEDLPHDIIGMFIEGVARNP